MTERSCALDFLLAQVSRLHHHRAHQLLDFIGLHRGQTRLMHTLWHQDGQSHSELAKKMEVTRATITRIVQRAEKAGFVERRSDKRDQRVSLVFLSEQGRAKRDQVFAAYAQMQVEAFAGFDEEELEEARVILERIRDNLKKVAFPG